MFPVLVDMGFLKLRTYGACMAIGFLACWWLVEKLSGRRDLSNFMVSLMLGGVLGSRIAYVIEHWRSEFAANPLNVFRIDQGGLMFYGGLILSILVFFTWCAIKKERPLALGDLFCTVVPLGHAFGRLGCFFYGCCYGKLSASRFAVRFPRHQRKRRFVCRNPRRLHHFPKTRLDIFRRNSFEIVTLTARLNRRWNFLQFRRRKNKNDARRRLFKRLQERVERLAGQHVYFVDDIDFILS